MHGERRALHEPGQPGVPVHGLAAHDGRRVTLHRPADDVALRRMEIHAVAAVQKRLDLRIGREAVRVLAVLEQEVSACSGSAWTSPTPPRWMITMPKSSASGAIATPGMS